jgi:hypothetical protein
VLHRNLDKSDESGDSSTKRVGINHTKLVISPENVMHK